MIRYDDEQGINSLFRPSLPQKSSSCAMPCTFQICAVMDIPVYDNIIESLHLLFTTFMEFKSNAHFVQLGSAERRLGASEEMKYTNFSRK